MDEELYLLGFGRDYIPSKNKEAYSGPYIPILKGPDDETFVEIWSAISSDDSVYTIGVAYTKEHLKTVGRIATLMELSRHHHCKLIDLKRLTFPSDIYDEVCEVCMEHGHYFASTFAHTHFEEGL